jgi:hypothetical protein
MTRPLTSKPPASTLNQLIPAAPVKANPVAGLVGWPGSTVVGGVLATVESEEPPVGKVLEQVERAVKIGGAGGQPQSEPVDLPWMLSGAGAELDSVGQPQSDPCDRPCNVTVDADVDAHGVGQPQSDPYDLPSCSGARESNIPDGQPQSDPYDLPSCSGASDSSVPEGQPQSDPCDLPSCSGARESSVPEGQPQSDPCDLLRSCSGARDSSWQPQSDPCDLLRSCRLPSVAGGDHGWQLALVGSVPPHLAVTVVVAVTV